MRSLRPSGFAAVALMVAGAAGAGAALFDPLFVAAKVTGSASACRPGGEEEALLADHAYPYGTVVEIPAALTPEEIKAAKRAKLDPGKPGAIVQFAPDFRFRLSPGAKVRFLDETTAGEGGVRERKVVELLEGSITTYLTAPVSKTGAAAGDAAAEANLEAVVVRTPLCDAVRMSDQNQIKVSPGRGEGEWVCKFAAPAGHMELVGKQFKVSRLRHNTEIVVSGTDSFTKIATGSGEFSVAFEKGADAEETVWFKSRTVGKIWRQFAAIGHRMSVSVMVSFPPPSQDAEGPVLAYSYLEGQTGVGNAESSLPEQGGEEAFSEFGDEGDGGDDAGFDSAEGAGDFSGFEGFGDEW